MRGAQCTVWSHTPTLDALYMDTLQPGMPVLYSVLCTLAFRVERQQPAWSNSLIGGMPALYLRSEVHD